MKQKNILLPMMVALMFAACNRNESNIFGGDTPTERIDTYMSAASNTLINATNGWEMLYFPTENQGGNVLICRFDSTGQVTFAARNEIATNNVYKVDDRSTWKMVGDQGPVLTFNTLNSILHAYSDPSVYVAGEGYQGDYEFIVLSHNANRVVLKGKKRATLIILNRLSDTQDWEQYFQKVYDYNQNLFASNTNMPMTIIDGNDTIPCTTGYCTLVPNDTTSKVSSYPLLIQPDCVHFYNQGINGAVNFQLNESKSELVCIDEGKTSVKIIPTTNPCTYFIKSMESKLTHWFIQEEACSEDVIDGINIIRTMAAKSGAIVTRFAFYQAKLNNQSTPDFLLRVYYSVDGNQYVGLIKLNCTINGEVITLSQGTADSSIEPLLNRISTNQAAALKLFTNVFNGSYEMTSFNGSKFTITNQLMVSTKTQGKQIQIQLDNTTL